MSRAGNDCRRADSLRNAWESVAVGVHEIAIALLVIAVALPGLAQGETWRGLEVAPEHRCSEYDRAGDYRYPASIEREIVRRIGGIYGPYSGTCFESMRETDIEHIVATSEAHDSGLCAQDRDTRMRFASDLRNLTLASVEINRGQKKGKDASEWIPDRNRCWFAARIVEVRRAYSLTIDRQEAESLERILMECDSTEMKPLVCHSASTSAEDGASGAGVLARYDDNGNGRITCKEARRHGIAPVARAHPAYPFMHDADGDGIVCE